MLKNNKDGFQKNLKTRNKINRKKKKKTILKKFKIERLEKKQAKNKTKK